MTSWEKKVRESVRGGESKEGKERKGRERGSEERRGEWKRVRIRMMTNNRIRR